MGSNPIIFFIMFEYFFYQVSVFENFLFFIFFGISIISALSIIIVKNSIYSVFFLVLNFLTAAGLLFLLECEFLALLFLIIYVGAIAVLFLFVIMMLDLKIVEENKDFLKYIPIGSLIGGLFFIEIMIVIGSFFRPKSYSTGKLGQEFTNIYINWYSKIDFFTDINVLGQVLYTYYIVQFILAGFILLLALIGTVALTSNNNYQMIKQQSVFKQISRDYRDILLI